MTEIETTQTALALVPAAPKPKKPSRKDLETHLALATKANKRLEADLENAYLAILALHVKATTALSTPPEGRKPWATH